MTNIYLRLIATFAIGTVTIIGNAEPGSSFPLITDSGRWITESSTQLTQSGRLEAVTMSLTMNLTASASDCLKEGKKGDLMKDCLAGKLSLATAKYITDNPQILSSITDVSKKKKYAKAVEFLYTQEELMKVAAGDNSESTWVNEWVDAYSTEIKVSHSEAAARLVACIDGDLKKLIGDGVTNYLILPINNGHAIKRPVVPQTLPD